MKQFNVLGESNQLFKINELIHFLTLLQFRDYSPQTARHRSVHTPWTANGSAKSRNGTTPRGIKSHGNHPREEQTTSHRRKNEVERRIKVVYSWNQEFIVGQIRKN